MTYDNKVFTIKNVIFGVLGYYYIFYYQGTHPSTELSMHCKAEINIFYVFFVKDS